MPLAAVALDRSSWDCSGPTFIVVRVRPRACMGDPRLGVARHPANAHPSSLSACYDHSGWERSHRRRVQSCKSVDGLSCQHRCTLIRENIPGHSVQRCQHRGRDLFHIGRRSSWHGPRAIRCFSRAGGVPKTRPSPLSHVTASTLMSQANGLKSTYPPTRWKRLARCPPRHRWCELTRTDFLLWVGRTAQGGGARARWIP